MYARAVFTSGQVSLRAELDEVNVLLLKRLETAQREGQAARIGNASLSAQLAALKMRGGRAGRRAGGSQGAAPTLP